jgi:hypothetical protein
MLFNRFLSNKKIFFCSKSLLKNSNAFSGTFLIRQHISGVEKNCV